VEKTRNTSSFNIHTKYNSAPNNVYSDTSVAELLMVSLKPRPAYLLRYFNVPSRKGNN